MINNQKVHGHKHFAVCEIKEPKLKRNSRVHYVQQKNCLIQNVFGMECPPIEASENIISVIMYLSIPSLTNPPQRFHYVYTLCADVKRMITNIC